MAKKALLGEIMLDHNVISPEQLEGALNDQQRFGGKIGENLVRMGAISQEQLLDFLSIQLNVAKIDFTRSTITIDALYLIPKKACITHNMIPVSRKDDGRQKRLLVAMADPLNFSAIQQAEALSQCVVTPVLALIDDIERAIDFCYSEEGLRELKTGLPSVTGIEMEEVPLDEEMIIYSQDGRELMVGMESRSGDLSLRVLIDMLAEKNLIDIDDFRKRLEKAKEVEEER